MRFTEREREKVVFQKGFIAFKDVKISVDSTTQQSIQSLQVPVYNVVMVTQNLRPIFTKCKCSFSSRSFSLRLFLYCLY